MLFLCFDYVDFVLMLTKGFRLNQLFKCDHELISTGLSGWDGREELDLSISISISIDRPIIICIGVDERFTVVLVIRV